MEINCLLCGWNFYAWNEYVRHIVDDHGIVWRREIPARRPDLLPIPFSGRGKRNIVDEAEQTWLAGHLL